MPFDKVRIHPTAIVSEQSSIGEGTSIWHFTHVRENVKIGKNCNIGQGVYIDFDVTLGDLCKVQNNAMLYHPAQLGKGVFVGPGVILTNDMYPRAVDATGNSNSTWEPSQTIIGDFASLGAGSIILPGIKIGKYALIGAGSVVTKDVPENALVIGSPARQIGTVDKNGKTLK